MKEIGGYFELELASKEEYHASAIKLNSGRNKVNIDSLNMIIKNPINNPKIIDLENTLTSSVFFLAPNACADNPVVPILRKIKFP